MIRLPRLRLAAQIAAKHRLSLHWRRSVLSRLPRLPRVLTMRLCTAAVGLYARRLLLLLLLWGKVAARVLRPKLRRRRRLSPRRRPPAEVADLHRRRVPRREDIG
jgi:hypothetical protein